MRRSNRIPIPRRKVVTCNRCGCPDLAWSQSKRTGKWYLCNVYVQNHECVMVTTAFHDCQQYLKDKHARETTECPGCRQRFLNADFPRHVDGCSELIRKFAGAGLRDNNGRSAEEE